MKLSVKALRAFSSPRYGNLGEGQVFDCESVHAEHWEQAGLVEIVDKPKPTYQTKVVQETPEVGDIPLDSGEGKEPSLSQAAQASPKRTRKSSKTKKQ